MEFKDPRVSDEKKQFVKSGYKIVAVRGKEEVYAFLTVTLPSAFLSIRRDMPLCQPSASRALVLEYLYEAGDARLLPKDLAARLAEFKVRRHQVSRRILRMNRRLEKEIGEKLVEKRGWHWALTSFTFESWGDSERNVGEEISEGD